MKSVNMIEKVGKDAQPIESEVRRNSEKLDDTE
jgi:hypothetical protein